MIGYLLVCFFFFLLGWLSNEVFTQWERRKYEDKQDWTHYNTKRRRLL